MAGFSTDAGKLRNSSTDEVIQEKSFKFSLSKGTTRFGFN